MAFLMTCTAICGVATVFPFWPLHSRRVAILGLLGGILLVGALNTAAPKSEWAATVERAKPTVADLEAALAAAKTDAEKLQLYRQLTVLTPGKLEYQNKMAEIHWRQRRAEAIRNNPEMLVRLTDFSWSKGGFGSVMLASFSLRNDLPYAVKDITVRCELSGLSGTTISKLDEIVYRTVEAGESIQVGQLNMGFIHGQSSSAACEVANVRR